jgi:hypothetical protein
MMFLLLYKTVLFPLKSQARFVSGGCKGWLQLNIRVLQFDIPYFDTKYENKCEGNYGETKPRDMTAESMLSRRSDVIHEDDVPMTHGANATFAELSAIGTCSAGSVMVPCLWFPEAAEMAATNGTLDVGVHLTLTSERKPYRWRLLTTPPRSV